MMKFTIACSLLLQVGLIAKAQDKPKNEITTEFEKIIPQSRASNYPAFKPLSISYEASGKTAYETKDQNGIVEDGTLNMKNRLNVNATFPLFVNKKIIVSSTFNYTHEEFRTSNTANASGFGGLDAFDLNDYSLSVNAIIPTKLFGKPAVITGAVIADSRDMVSLQKLRGILGATVIVKKNAYTTVSLGLIGIIDPSSPFPVFPAVTYFHKFRNSNWEFNGILPVKLQFRRANTFGGWLTAGTDFAGNSFFNQKQFKNLSEDYEMNYAEIRLGLGYEYPVNKYLLLGVKGGVKKMANNRVNQVYEKRNNYLFKTTADATTFVNFSLSFTLPKK